MTALLDAYCLMAWSLSVVAALLLQRQKKPPRWIDVPAIVIFAFGWPIILPIVALVMRRGRSPKNG